MIREADDINIQTYTCMSVCVCKVMGTKVDQMQRTHKGPDPNSYKIVLKETEGPPMTGSHGRQRESAEQSGSGSEEVVLREWGKKRRALEPYSKLLQYHTTTHWLKENLPVHSDRQTDRQEETRYFLRVECQ